MKFKLNRTEDDVEAPFAAGAGAGTGAGAGAAAVVVVVVAAFLVDEGMFVDRAKML